jgi:hypothetical protein
VSSPATAESGLRIPGYVRIRIRVTYTVAYRQKGFDNKLRYKIFEGTGTEENFWRRIDRMYGTKLHLPWRKRLIIDF